MNEQLIVKNFGPIKDATVDFKRVTVFIGPTGGGKSTLAKLAAVFYNDPIRSGAVSLDALKTYNINKFWSDNSQAFWKRYGIGIRTAKGDEIDAETRNAMRENDASGVSIVKKVIIDSWLSKEQQDTSRRGKIKKMLRLAIDEGLDEEFDALLGELIARRAYYIPAERIFLSAIEYSKDGLMRYDIGLPESLLDFSNSLASAKKELMETEASGIDISFLNVRYLHNSGQDFIKIPDREEPLMLLETASGIQSVTPLLVLLEHLSRNTEQAQSFIIEEPELNLYPTAQQGLLNWLVEKCTKGDNDLTITTHSPYILSSCNLLLEAYKVAQLRPDLEDEIAAIVPKSCWLNPDEFAAYYVADGTVKPITDERTHLIGGNELDAVSGDISDSFRKLLRLKKQAA